RFSLFAIITVAIIVTGIVLQRAPFAAPLALEPSLPRAASIARAEILGPRVSNDIPFPEITARSAAVVDAATGALLGEKEKDAVQPIASVTKLMTALVFLDTNPSWQEVITMERSDNRAGGALFVYPGEQLTLYDLFMTMLVGSANNAAVALARVTHLSPEAFADRMNERAQTMGLFSTHFTEPTGLDRGNVSSALDLVRLGWKAFFESSLREALTTKEHVFITTNTHVRHRVKTTDDLLSSHKDDYTIIGAKTGFTNEAGYTFLVEAQRGEQQVIVAVLGAPTEEDRFHDADTLIRWAFARYQFSDKE
ncbi:D-alanyl-D-alanine carboxypeptidase, partial [Candidatus Uhrbacteria bacterium]|nr:D-alanyl-D-alanine carboxypeptidase [Candidatus Uhrbacteria bacterium]